MKLSALSVIFVALALLVPSPVHAAALENLLGDKHAIILFAKSRSDASLDKQIGLLSERRPSLDQRRMVVIMVTSNREAMTVLGYASIGAGSGRQLLQEFEPSPGGLTGVLVSKDGEEVMRWHGVREPQEIFDAIDGLEDQDEEEDAPGVSG